jgi:hypothetical protein
MRAASILATVILLAGCGAHHGAHYTITAVASPEGAARWVRMDTQTGDMLLCRVIPTASDAGASTLNSADPTFACTPASPGVAAHFEKTDTTK